MPRERHRTASGLRVVSIRARHRREVPARDPASASLPISRARGTSAVLLLVGTPEMALRNATRSVVKGKIGGAAASASSNSTLSVSGRESTRRCALLARPVDPRHSARGTRLRPDRSVEHDRDAAALETCLPQRGFASARIMNSRKSNCAKNAQGSRSLRGAAARSAARWPRSAAWKPSAAAAGDDADRTTTRALPSARPDRGHLKRAESEPVHASTCPLRKLRRTNSW